MKLLLTLMLICLTAFSFSQSITIVSPNGGETLQGCTPVNITWTESATSNFYDIDYSPNNGVTWVSVATAVNTVSGFYSWTVPNIASTNFKIRIKDNNAPSTFDESDFIFTVQAPLLLNSPNGGEYTTALSNMPIVFSANGTSNNYLLEYSTNSGSTWSTIANNQTILGGSYNWNVPNVNTSNAMIQLTDVNNTCITDKSDAVFTIASEIDVTQPNGGEVWQANIRQFPGGLGQDILIDSDKTEYVYDGNTIFDHGGASNYAGVLDKEVVLLSAIPGKAISLNFTEFYTDNSPQDRLYIYDGPSTSSPLIGSYYSTQNPGTVVSTHPTGALMLRWDVNSSSTSYSGFRADVSIIGLYDLAYKEIKWDRVGTSNVFDIEYSIDNGVGWKPIISNYNNIDGIYRWHVPNDPTTQALVRVKDSGNGAIVDQSDAVFTIGQSDPLLFSPNGGEKLMAGLNHEITWEEGLFAGTSVAVDYSTDNGSTWTLIHSGTPNDGEYTWNLPDDPSTQALIRVSEFGNPTFFDVSDSVFTMTSYVAITSPLGGEVFTGCEVVPIEWCAGLTSGDYKLEYSDDGGVTWNLIVDNYTLAGTSLTYNWVAPNLNSTQLVVRVSDAQTLSYTDQTTNMTVSPSQHLDLTAPNGGAQLVMGTVYPITYTATGPVSSVNLSYSLDNGVTWLTIVNNTSGGVYNWAVPNQDSDLALVRAEAVGNPCITDQSDNVFSLVSEITLTAPNGGEIWQSTIRQFPNGVDQNIEIDSDRTEYVYTGQKVYDHGGANAYSGTQDHTVTLRPAIVGHALQLAFSVFYVDNSPVDRLYIYDGPSSSSPLIGQYTSSSNPGTIISTHPSGALTLRWDANTNTSYHDGFEADLTTIDPYLLAYEDISWDVIGTSGIYDLQYSINNGTTWIPIISDYASATGEYKWHVPNTPTTQALYRVLDAGNGQILDVSDGTFTINKAEPHLFLPNGGEKAMAGLTQEIEWEPGLFIVSTVRLDYSTDNGTSWNTITTGTNNDGAYTWNVPDDPSDQALVRVSEFGNVAVNDVSDSTFTMTSYIALETPLGGESVNGCETLPITWCAGATSGTYKLEYSEDSGATWSLIVNNHAVAGTNPTYNWVLPNLSSSQFRVRVSDAQVSSKTDQSTDITLSPSQYLDLTSPNGGEQLVMGSVYPITYTATGPVSNVNLYYSVNNGASWSTIVNNTNGGSYAWTVPNFDSDSVLVRAQASGNTCITDQSDSLLNLISEITITAPNGGETWQSTIRQFPNGVDQNIEIDSDRTEYVYTGQKVYDHGGANDYIGIQDHTVTLRPAIIGHALQLAFSVFYTDNSPADRLYIYDGPSASSPLLGQFSGSANPGTFISSHPSGALTLRWDANTSSTFYDGFEADLTTIDPYSLAYEDITWDVIGTSGTYDLQYSINNGATWIPIISDYTSPTGEYRWHVPNNPTTQALYRILDAGNGQILDVSDATFTINKADPHLFSPNGGEKALAGLTQEIEWEPGLFVVSTVRLDYSTDNGTSWNTITTGTNNDGAYTWNVPDDPSDQALVRVSEFGNTAVNDVSDTTFTMTSYVALTSPLGGEMFNGCEAIPITWCAGATTGMYKLEYSEDSGATWNLIENNYAAAGTSPSYSWILPNLSSSQFRVRVSDAQVASKTDQSTDITLSPSQYLDLTSPNGGEQLVMGSVYPITYTATGPVSNVNLYYSVDNGASWITIVNNTNGGSYAWTVPNFDSDSVLVRAQASGNTCITDQSDSVLSLISEITITAPNGGEMWQSTIRQFPNGVDQNIEIDSDRTEYVYTGQKVYDHGGANAYSGPQDHTVTLRPAIIGHALQLAFSVFYVDNSPVDRLYIYNGPSTSSPLIGQYTSSSNPGTVVSTHPSGALTLRWDANTYTAYHDGFEADLTTIDPYSLAYEDITWNVTGTSGTYDLQYSIDNGANWIPIISDYVSPTGEYRWHVPNNPTTQALYRVLDAGNGQILDVSDATFTINKAQPHLFSPNGGEKALAGLTQEIEWEPGLFVVSTVRLDYSTDNGTSWNGISAGTNNDGAFTWNVPDDPSDQALVRVSEFGNVAVNDVSDTTFTMTSYVQLTSPLGGESFSGCEPIPINWCAGLTSGMYKLEYSEDGGATWNLIINNYAAAGTSPSYSWVLPNLNSSQFRVRVSDAQTSSKTDQSGDITLSPSQYLDLTSPNGGEQLVVGSVYPITYTASGPVSNVNLYYSLDNGVSWSVIANNTNGGTYAWTVPNYDSDNVLVRAQASGNTCITDQSDNVLSLISEITLTAPNGGEIWQSTIRQFPNGVDQNIEIDSDRTEYVYTGQKVYDHGGPNDYSGTQDHTVTLRPAIIGHALQLVFSVFEVDNSPVDRLYIYNGPSSSSPLIGQYTSSSYPGTIVSTHPSGALTLRWDANTNTAYHDGFEADLTTIDPYSLAYEDITWDVIGTSGTYDLQYSINNGATWIPIISDYVSPTGEYKWHVPNNPTTQALYRVLDAGNGQILDVSDATFTINKAQPHLFSPNGGEKVLAGLTHEITWEPGLFITAALQLDYSTDNGTSWNLITTGTNNDGSYIWNVPDDPSDQALIRVSEFGNTSVNDVSDSTFTMTSYIALESPLGGETISGCENLQISWCAGATSGDYKLEYSEDGGTTWDLIIDNYTLVGTNLNYGWVLPNISSSQFKIRVSDAQFAAKTDQSGDITIGSTQYVQLTDPNGGDSLVSFTVRPVDYLTSGPVSNVNLYYSVDHGVSWNTIVNNTNGGMYAWTIPNVDSDSALVKVQASNNVCINDISDDYIHMISDIAVTQPNGGETWKSTIRQFPNGVDQDILIDSDRTEYVYTGQKVYDHGGAGDYSGTQDHIVTLRPAIVGHALQLAFTQFYTDNSPADRLYIYDGPSTSSPLLGQYFGSTTVGTHISSHPTGALTLRWDANTTSTYYDGFEADLTTIDPYSLAYEDVYWDVIGTSGTYHLEYSVDAGASWTRIISNHTSATGEYRWHVPNDPSTNALVRVIDAGSGLVVDQSDNVFTIDQADPVLFYPNGGEDLFSQSPYMIEWEPGLFIESAIRIQYTTDNGNTWNSIVNGTNNDGFYEWTPPIFPQSYPESRIRISEFNSGIFDMSDTLFTLSPAIQIYSPNGGNGNDSLRGCTETTVIFKAGGTTQDYLMQYSPDGGSTWTDIESSYFSDSTLTNYDWIIPNLISDDFFIKVSDAGDLTKFDITDFAYNIRQPITIVTPNNPGNLTIGSTYTITWDSDGASNFFDLYYSTDAGATWTTIAINQNITNNQYDWVIPNDASSQVLVRVVDNIDNCKEDFSDNLLNITPSNSPILVTTPNGGESWIACGDSLITWDAIGTSGTFDIDYSINGGATWTNIVSNYATVTNEYLWSLPSVQENQVVIRVTDATDLSKTDMSDGLFSLVPVVPANITASGPTTFCAGGTITLTSSSPTGNLWSPGLQTTQSITVSASGSYSVQVTAGGCVATSSQVNVTVNPVPNTPIAGGDTQVAIGDPINLTATTIAGATYSWTGPSGFTSNQQNPIIPNANFNNSGTYSVTVELNGCTSLANTHDVNVGNTAAISGEVYTETGVLVPGVNVTATGYSTQNAVTVANGFYELFLENNETYSVEPFKNNDVAVSNGITTLDLILIQRHILNITDLNSPYKLMAADVNFSDDITTLDILLAQSLILQNTNSYPNGRLWSFINSDYVFADPTNPFPYIESRDYVNISDAPNQDFTAMKLGDVNNSWDPNIAKDDDEVDYLVQLGNVKGEMNSTVTIPVSFDYENLLAGFQMTMDWDPNTMEFVSLNGVLVDPKMGKVDGENGTLPLSWYAEDPVGISVDGELAFEMVFRLKNTPTQTTQLRVNSSVIKSEMYSSFLKVIPVGSTGGEVDYADQNIVGMDIYPNPFNDELELSIELASDQDVTVIMLNSLGAQISSREAFFETGSHELSLSDWLVETADLANGVYWVAVETDNERYIRKIIKL